MSRAGTRVSAVVAIWLAGTCLIWSAIIAGALRHERFAATLTQSPLHWLGALAGQFDGIFYADIAAHGYQTRSDPCCSSAFLPGYPLTVRGASDLTGIPIDVAALAVSLVASLAATLVLHRLVLHLRGPAIALAAVALFVINPMAVFLGVAYSEALFLALVLGGWLSALQDRWQLAGLLVGLSCVVRIPGLVALLALLVLAATGDRPLRRVARLWPALIAVPLLALWTWRLHELPGRWDEWFRAEDAAWGRTLTWPWSGFLAWVEDLRTVESAHLTFVHVGEITAVILILVLLGHLLRTRALAEATFVGGNAFLMTFAPLWMSAPRYAMTCFPAYIWLAGLVRRHRTAFVVLCAVSLSLSLANGYAWGSGWWVA